ncbi:putative protein SPIRAL1 [Helianthus annuus]|uniref:Putative SPIRAL1-like5 n=1 Tax=Helianthus annuus TaxID=4232 RepID=A0A251SV19_HELAN|nr:protein SPIRAL1-like 5 [Helianthus annuus]KAF5774801.1 putative protein SPIRAL1 [Helianthus annuus]KAJ0478060.1 putative protein SPIRAL1 [Helianthus annuus]KAJ0482709.1 putative protein SPIRAL1 [Helianthus annuus]KAJ0498938.1 putative protein SPIRAL1 [Helianthus annuus]KAJ0664953.1 putative protein SPIRAL1 [Helianthus annuus]
MMNKRRSSGGGQSSLGYLFGSDDLLGQQQKDQSKVPVSPVCMPPYGTDKEEKLPEKLPTPHKKDDTGSSSNYIYHGDGDKSSGFLVTDRPSTRVKSVPGGDSSLGYLFGDK